ncbi:hypothetical protein GGTG_06134 [Gaeumannomyces tritici R3-111a-1]|uniref:Uncharacterized protein n=1 Tax=Gaeumannomyces tritici (strain R3-111a-1) TaxID=644352 RepID=J3NXX9_GAET3|nr:hypothetical protein GGTG_06134 [Gaeumannomyces tritici R3-111a-1]EJT76212.1 hypothetical protein GGTG_06134 [Gaeumannomyces tritici R3-111a-1]
MTGGSALLVGGVAGASLAEEGRRRGPQTRFSSQAPTGDVEMLLRTLAHAPGRRLRPWAFALRCWDGRPVGVAPAYPIFWWEMESRCGSPCPPDA